MVYQDLQITAIHFGLHLKEVIVSNMEEDIIYLLSIED